MSEIFEQAGRLILMAFFMWLSALLCHRDAILSMETGRACAAPASGHDRDAAFVSGEEFSALVQGTQERGLSTVHQGRLFAAAKEVH